jgi:FKBP-type peptidyl-prolyl cis-trans isomerase
MRLRLFPRSQTFLLPVVASAAFSLLSSGCAVSQPASTTQVAAPPVAASAMSSAPNTLQIIDRKIGDGATVETNTPVAVHYSGYLWSPTAPESKGTKFDSSLEKITPYGFFVGARRVIAGWDEGLIGMKVGGQRTLIIPPEKAYGAKGSPDGQIPPNATLVFDIELMAVVGKTANPNAKPSPYVPAAPAAKQ